MLGDKCLQSQLVISFTRADVPRVASPCIVFLDFPLAFLLSSCRWWWFFFGGGGMAKTLGRITKFIKSHEEDHFSKTSFKGRGPKNHPSSPRPPPPLLQATINNDWSLTETFPRSMIMINKSLPQEPISPHFLWVYQRNNLRGMLGEHHVQAFLISCSPNIPTIIKWILSPVNR